MSGAGSRSLGQTSYPGLPENGPESKVRFEVPHSASTIANRRTTVYDAVAGRVNVRGFHPLEAYASRHRDTASSGARELHPEEVLFRRGTNANTKRPLGDESYFAHEDLPADILPSSNILEAVHAYTADFYKHQPKKARRNDYHSMDETALLAMGILVEELANEALGDTGDMVLVEGESSDADDSAVSDAEIAPQRRRRKRGDTSLNSEPVTAHEHLRGVQQKRKRRRLRRGSDTDLDTMGKGK
ncbi:hypothetical protein N7492_009245 [Penicillium capsulatum]|uniref:Uncharacterized protein n=1 Tax=Penicillium capsulatum TaxID=69766 RepID=A0A9W9HTN1_9EURO|nr:hypothetical protein N7492_009245 [Penicillium capsulatum]KAJ6106640.1 hypothetical protein N7512_010157 [Penicillium capsulatum]